MIIVGIDPSLTRTSVAIGGTCDNPKLHSIEVRNFPGSIQNRFLRYQSIVNRVEACVTGLREPVIFLEGYGFMSQKAVDMAEFGSVLRVMLLRIVNDGGRLIEVPPKSLKSFTAENGNADKEYMARSARRRWGVTFKSDDECDAYCMWRFGRAYCGIDVELSEAQLLAIENVKHPVKKVKKRKPKKA